MDADGKNRTRLTDLPPGGRHPSWSPDGQRIAFDNGGIYVIDADGKNQTRLTNGWYPSWSPDGQRIAFAIGGAIYVMDADGKNQTRLTDHTVNDEDPNWSDEGPSWSPDGQRIAFVRLRRTKTTTGHNVTGAIYVMDADGKNQTRLTNGWYPSWSPDGQRIAFDAGSGIYVIDADGKNITQITNNHNDWFASWSPDGQRIAFSSNRDGDREIYVIDLD